MKHLFFYIAALMVLFSCTDRGEGDDLKVFNVNIFNSSNTNFIIRGYNTQDDLEFEYNINTLEDAGNVTYLSNFFDGYRNDADSIVVVFPNSKGYICDLRQSGNSLCFPNKNLLIGLPSFFNDLGNNNYQFTITQDDFDNAFDLP